MSYSKLQSRNDTVPTKRNDAATFYQQATISLAKNQMLVVEFPSKPISTWLRKITQNDDASTNLDDAVLDMPYRYQLLVDQQASILTTIQIPAEQRAIAAQVSISSAQNFETFLTNVLLLLIFLFDPYFRGPSSGIRADGRGARFGMSCDDISLDVITMAKATVACKSKGRKYCSCVGTLQRSVALKWKEDKIAFWSAEQIWKLSNGKIFTEAIY
ncbi:hypothetical protein F511_17586 [Dorcoceras hygrometricum]|uniref:Uncharacterized protein n=1 Tax=Dorcoceras hygrometricum TaxID=472368 RepID=A0A2Z7BXY3_9LAMI|nr:hypothetical protein F511_17586 [Dorcoceras hygrometricum]